MKVRFQADNDLGVRIIAATKLFNSELGFQTAPNLGLHLKVLDD
jgi:hypothetical protein